MTRVVLWSIKSEVLYVKQQFIRQKSFFKNTAIYGHVMICKFESEPLSLPSPVCASLEGSDEIECMCRLISAFAL